MYKVEILEAMRALKRIWIALPPTMFHKCSKHTGILQSDATVARDDMEQGMAAEINTLDNKIKEIVPERTTVSITAFLNATGEEECVE